MKSDYWMTPIIGERFLDIKDKVILYLLVRRTDGTYLLFISISQDGYSTSFTSDELGNLLFKIRKRSRKDICVKFIASIGNCPFALTRTAMNIIRELVFSNFIKKSSEMVQTEKRLYYDKLGFCTWNAFYEDVSHNKIISALESFSKNNIPIGYIVIDDGWQQTTDDKQLIDFMPNSGKFPRGLKGLVTDIELMFPMVEYIGVW